MAGVSFKTAKAAIKAPAQAAEASQATAKPVGGFIVSDAGGERIPPMDTGVYQAVIIGLYDIGTQETAFGGKRKLVAQWEIPGETVEVERDGETVALPRNISQRYTMSLNEKAKLRQDVQAVLCRVLTKEECRAFDLAVLLGKNAQIQVVQDEKDGKIFANIETVMACPKGMSPVVPTVTPAMFHLGSLQSADEAAIPETCPRWVKKLIMASPEWAALGGSPMVDDRD